MDIAHIVWSFRTGGIENMLVDIMECQADDRHDVSLFVINDDYEPSLLRRISPKVRVVLLRRRPGARSPWFALRLNWLLRSVTAIHCHQANLLPLLLPCYHHKIVLTVHSFQSRMGRIPSKCRVVAISPEVAENLRFLGLKRHIHVIPNGLPCTRIPFARLQAYDSITYGPFKIVQVGRLLHQSKGQDLLIMAIGALRDMGISNVHADFIGEGESEPVLRELAAILGVESQVNFLGNRSREYVSEHLGDYHLMAHPARSEGFGLAVAEAMAGGVPVLVPDSGPLCALVDNGRYGATFHSGDHRDLARIISALMRHHADAVAKTPTARQHIIDRYSLRHQVSAYARLYQRCFFE